MEGPTPDRCDVVVLVASAGGFEAISRVLVGLPHALGAPVVIAQHLSGAHEKLAALLSRQVGRTVAWAADGAQLGEDAVVLCPPGTSLELLPDRTCSVRALGPDEGRGRFDTLLMSAADAFGASTLAVVLSGFGRDGTAGALAVRAAGGTVLVQDEISAARPSMPRSVVEADAADRVLPVDEIGHVIGLLVAGSGPPPSPSELTAVRSVFTGRGEVARIALGTDWAATSLGAVREWPSVLRTTLRLALDAPLAMCLLWGPDHVQLYNDAYRDLMGDKHPTGLGRPHRECWPEVWHLNEGVFARVRAGEPVEMREALYPINRHGTLEDAWFDLNLIPCTDEAGAVPGILCTVVERTAQVLAARRLRTLDELTDRTAGAVGRRSALEQALGVLARHDEDVVFALAYRVDHRKSVAHLVHGVGLHAGSRFAPLRVPVGERSGWPLAHAAGTGDQVLVGHIGKRFAGSDDGEEEPPCEQALVAPLPHTGGEGSTGVLVLGLRPRLRLDARYEEFLRAVGRRIAVRLGEAYTRERERERLERLADLDRAKTAFLADVSHELRTPLTLVLTPIEDLLARADLPEELCTDVELVRRSLRRLLRLAGALLDFSQVQAGRLRARFEPTDLAALTTDVAGMFRAAAEGAGLVLQVDAHPLQAPVWVDPQIWEKILSNLLSNALRFTFKGRIDVQVRALPEHVEVRVRDTGVGIPDAELPHLFQRFRRVHGARGRSHDGAGIGLALTDELIRRHRGRIRVSSEEGVGTTVTVWLPLGVPPDLEHPPEAHPQRSLDTAAALAEEAGSWGQADGRGAADGPGADDGRAGARVLLVEGDPDLRRYLRRLLDPVVEVQTATDGADAVEAVRARRPDLVLADVTPTRDGLTLVRTIRADPVTEAVPVVLLTARGGQDAAVDGRLAGADDYVTKPFSRRDLLARVTAQIELARVRRRAEDRFRALVDASWDVVYRMGPDWTGMRVLGGRGVVVDTPDPTTTWIDAYVPTEDRPEVDRAVRRAVETGSVFALEHRVIRPDGTIGRTLTRAVPLLDDRGRIVEWIGATGDLTGRRAGTDRDR